MKNILYIIGFLSICISCKAQQQIIPLETKGFPVENTYYKDLNNELSPYIGTWKGTFNNQNFIITFSKYKNYNSTGNYYKDRLAGKYKMLDSNNNELYSTYNLPDNEAKVTSLGFVEQTNHTKLRLVFIDSCIEGEIHLSFDNPQQTQMHWKYFTKQELVVDDSGCASYNEMPRGEFTLTKQ
ncbi:MAG: hypothetical protein P0Y62_14970 [Candidatus Chryseobacterium colombiense]|nr:DUF6705 family protein [Chryseobacterium sp.]WEK69140.1 MAG: hypothetical protein P0Y62_14970 [Chryseobacterium sp.]